jgi:hypothetical protein
VINNPQGWSRPSRDPYPFAPQQPYIPQARGWVWATPDQFTQYASAWPSSPPSPSRRPRRTAAILGGIALLALVAAGVGATVALSSGADAPTPKPVPAHISTPTTSPPSITRILPAVRDHRS